jgi:DNA-binding NarL/FixJ family response regulator
VVRRGGALGTERGSYLMAVVAERRVDAVEVASLRVLIADDHPLMLAGIRRALERADGIEIAGEARSGPELLEMIERRRPDLVLMDLRMPGVTGADCIERIREGWPDIRIVVLSACDDRPSIDSALEAGASAYIVKSVNPFDVASALRQAWGAGTIFHSVTAPRPVFGTPVSVQPEGPVLTERERTILASVAQGMTTAAISESLWVSEHTVKFHLTNIYRKLGVPNRAAAVRFALENNIAS